MAFEPNRWGIIYCPKEGTRRSHKRWESIRAYLKEKGVAYDFVQSESVESVQRLTEMLVHNGYETIVLVGGDSALNDAINGLMKSGPERLVQIALGLIPNGLVNDYATFWGFEEDNYRFTIDQLIKRRIRKVDVGQCRFTVDEKEQTRYFINCVNVGLVASIMSLKYSTRRFWGVQWISILASNFLLFFKRLDYRVRLRVNYQNVDVQTMNVCVGNSRAYGLTPSAVPYNGMLDVSIVKPLEMTQVLHALWLLYSGRFLNNKKVYPYRTQQFTLEDCGRARISLDGRSLDVTGMPMTISVQQECLNLIIPS